MEIGLWAVAFLWLCDAVSASYSYSYPSGPFTITYDSTQAPSLRVDYGGREVWFTSKDNATFVTAARVVQSVQQTGGNFVFTSDVQEVCSDMKITANGSKSALQDSGYPQASSSH